MKLCLHPSARRALMCRKCWERLPAQLRDSLSDIRRTKDGQSQGTLRVEPTAIWREKALRALAG